jgi:hypothetical protein
MIYVFLLDGPMGLAGGGWMGKAKGKALATLRAQPGTRVKAKGNFFICFGRNHLKNPDSTKGIQGNASLFPWLYLDFLARNSPAGCI